MAYVRQLTELRADRICLVMDPERVTMIIFGIVLNVLSICKPETEVRNQRSAKSVIYFISVQDRFAALVCRYRNQNRNRN